MEPIHWRHHLQKNRSQIGAIFLWFTDLTIAEDMYCDISFNKCETHSRLELLSLADSDMEVKIKASCPAEFRQILGGHGTWF